MNRCPYCGADERDTVSYGDFIKKNKIIIRHRKCFKCKKCFPETK